METLFFQTRSVLLDYGIAKKQMKSLLQSYVAFEVKEYSDTDDAIALLLQLTDKIQHKMVDRFSHENTYESFLKLLWIFDEIHSRYLAEKSARVKLVENNIDDEGINEAFGSNRNTMSSFRELYKFGKLWRVIGELWRVRAKLTERSRYM